MKILLTGGTGLIGQHLIKHLIGNELVVLTRNTKSAQHSLRHVKNKRLRYLSSLDSLMNLNSFDAVINLAGEPIAKRRWHSSQKEKICQSRWHITQKLVELIQASSNPPSVFISGSAIGIYGNQSDQPFDETLPIAQHEFSTSFPHHVCTQWEQIALGAQSEKTRVCLLRTGMVLALDGGALKKMLPIYRCGLGGHLGSGTQYVSWIHIHDMVRVITFLLHSSHTQGAFHGCTPHAVTNKVFSQTLARTLQRPHFLSTPSWLVTALMGEAACLLLDSAWAKPTKLTMLGFKFQFSHLESAFKNLLSPPL